MWIVTDKGFFSFVVDRKDPNYLWLRARLREDLERNFPGVEVTEHPGADYLFRAKVLRTDVAERIAQMVLDADITSHFKDVANQRSAKPVHGSRSRAMYAFWSAMAEVQPYAPYSKVPRPAPKPWTPPKGVPAGQGALFSDGGWRQPVGGFTRSTNGGQRASAFDWDSRSWEGGVSSPDPARGQAPGASVDADVLDEVTEMLLSAATEEEFEEVWATLTDEERTAYLDAQEETQRQREEIEEEFGAAARMLELHQGPDGWITSPDGAYPAPRLTRAERRAKARREEKPNLSTLEGRNRQAYLDKKAKRRGKGRKNRHNQQG